MINTIFLSIDKFLLKQKQCYSTSSYPNKLSLATNCILSTYNWIPMIFATRSSCWGIIKFTSNGSLFKVSTIICEYSLCFSWAPEPLIARLSLVVSTRTRYFKSFSRKLVLKASFARYPSYTCEQFAILLFTTLHNNKYYNNCTWHLKWNKVKSNFL